MEEEFQKKLKLKESESHLADYKRVIRTKDIDTFLSAEKEGWELKSDKELQKEDEPEEEEEEEPEWADVEISMTPQLEE